ncbi:MAG: type II toxin-antitoxin system VapC family toxin [Burkholderiaceae bacterium]|nr:type II toxin-antitoxin system VapC family toxin [Burkholderiaceae bacterium]
MIILDTNVLSEVLRSTPDRRVLAWLKEQSPPSLFTTTVTRGEILYGIRLLPDGKRRRALWDAARAIFNEDFAERVLSFDNDAADAYAEVGASRRAAGRPISQFDAMIAGVARSRGASLATRNAKDFESCGIDVVDPWSA